MIRKYTYLDGQTFTDVFAYLEKSIDMSIFTAKQIAMMMEICYDQHNKGYDKCAHENSLYLLIKSGDNTAHILTN